ncbi:MAG: ammonia-forming cytochrome c nitrite reductase subunit c552 [Bacteroidales bacterium]
MSIRDLTKQKPWLNWVLFFATVIIVFIIGLFAASIVERRSEAQLYFQMVNPIPEWEPDNAVWGENFPRQYQTYLNTLDTTFRSRYAGSATINYLEKYPEMVVLWAGYSFSKGYNQGRGHYYALTDIRETLRTDVPQPATCWTCKSPDVPGLMNTMGVAEFYSSTWMELGSEIQNPIGCQDCHDSETMNLIITRPALVEAFERRGLDINEVSHQEMRTLVCAQCHVEYYFRGEGTYLTFPWDDGLTADDMEEYYDRIEHVDFMHALSRTPILKAQHPDYEMYRTGIHSKRGVSCSDCHAPYRREGGVKFTDHHFASPLQNVENSCQVCHRESEEDLIADVYAHQDKISELRRIAEKNLARVHIEAKHAWDAGATEEEMIPVLQLIRHSQWRWDWVAAANGYGIHSPTEALRVLATSIQKAQQASLELTVILHKYGVDYPIDMPDLSTQEKAQAYIGLDMEQLQQQKQQFREQVLPEWLKAM